MFKRTHLASAVFLAMSCQLSYAQEAQQEATASEEPIEVIQVSGIRSSLNKALNIKRQNMQVVDAIIAEDIGKFPDNNVVEALQRVTGIQVTDRGAGEVSTVTIRGLSDVTTTVNGRNLFTAAGRQVALADVPAALLESVNVYKTRSAAQIGSGIAGQIDIQTQRPFNFEDSKVVVAARGIHQEQADKTDPQVSFLASDRWDLDNGGEFGALVNLSFTRTSYRDQSVTAGAAVPFVTENPTASLANGAPFGPLQRIFPADCSPQCWTPGLDAGLPFAAGSTLNLNGTEEEYYLSRDAVFGSDFTGERERPAVNVSLQWAPNDRSIYTFEAFYNGYRNDSFNSLHFTFVDWWGDAANLNDPVIFEGTNIIKERQVNAPYGFQSGDLTSGKTDTYMYALAGQWDITDDFRLESEVYYQDSKFEDEFFAMRTDRVAPGLDVDFNTGNGIPSLSYWDDPNTEINEADLTQAELWNVAQLYDNGSSSEGDALTFTVDGEYLLYDGIFERIGFGVFYDDRSATDAFRGVDGFVGAPMTSYDEGLVHVNENFFDGNADFPTAWAVPDGYYISANRDEFRDIYGFTADQLMLEKTFAVDEVTTAAYVEADFRTEVGGRELDGQVGVRYEHAKTDMTFYDNAVDPTGISSDSSSNSKFLPSLVARYHISDDLLARFAYTETIRRPNFTDLNSFIYYQEDVTDIGYGTATGGNPDLEPVESVNLDVTLEYYFGEGSSIYATWFQRDIDGLVYPSRFAVEFEGTDTIEAGTYIVSQPGNTSNGKLDGWELGAVYFPEGLPEVLDGFGIQASATFLDSNQDIPVFEEGEIAGYTNQPIFGVSDSSYSTVFIYDKEEFSARLSYVWRDDFLANYEAASFANPLGVYRAAEESLDFQMSYDVTENLTLTFDATNLTEEIFQSYYQYPDVYNLGNALYSRTFALGLRFQM